MANKKNKPYFSYVFIILLVFILLVISFIIFSFIKQSRNIANKKIFTVTRVIDGDTIVVSDIKGNTIDVRYLNVDAPELPTISKIDFETCYASEALNKNKSLVLNKKVMLEYDVDRFDQFGRTLAYVYTIDKNLKKELFVNKYLAQKGYATFYLDKMNVKYQPELMTAVMNAQKNYAGLWGVCGEKKFNSQCVIKGNIDTMGKKYYHLPGDKYYKITTIRFDKEDQWLCTLQEAESKHFLRSEWDK